MQLSNLKIAVAQFYGSPFVSDDTNVPINP